MCSGLRVSISISERWNVNQFTGEDIPKEVTLANWMEPSSIQTELRSSILLESAEFLLKRNWVPLFGWFSWYYRVFGGNKGT
ncbi:hypothetical protein HQN90_22995 [Paenibacillus alba]|nr:hypothetical protein [Paenibacillus alba]